MRYFYILPLKAQFYFPGNYKKYPFVTGFYESYTLTGSILWWCWKKIPFFKYFFQVDDSQVPDLYDLKTLFGNETILVINKGTPGPEQKTSAIGFIQSNNKKFFVKYAKYECAKKLVFQEYTVLQKLQFLRGIPPVLNFVNNQKSVLLQTGYIDGKKYKKTNLTQEVMDLLMRFTKLENMDFIDYSGDFTGEKTFAHGDFCPWNMLFEDNNLTLIDWEKAGMYPAGYDLFTYVFQTQFLCFPFKKPSLIFYQNEVFVKSYFAALGISSWRHYLEYFVKNRLEYYKENKSQQNKYSELLKLVQKTDGI